MVGCVEDSATFAKQLSNFLFNGPLGNRKATNKTGDLSISWIYYRVYFVCFLQVRGTCLIHPDLGNLNG